MEFKNRNPKIYMVAGKARNGKDSIAQNIVSYYQLREKKTINLQFSSYIKEYAKKISDWDGREEEKPRELLQQLGTTLIRKKIDENFFIRRIIEDINVYSYFFDVIVLSDVRFDLELMQIKNAFQNVKRIKVVRPGVEQVLGNLKQHETENSLVNDELYDKIINNDGSLEELERKVYQMLEEENEEY